MVTVLSFDDFYEDYHNPDLLFELKNRIPQLKVNLFTILGKCSDEWIEETKKIPWIDMIPHGWDHDPGECEFWTREDAFEYLDRIEQYGLTKGFKAPGWRISNETYEALLERGYWVADDPPSHAKKRNPTLRTYINTEGTERRIQGHMGALPDGLKEQFGYYVSLVDGRFLFIKDVIFNATNGCL